MMRPYDNGLLHTVEALHSVFGITAIFKLDEGCGQARRGQWACPVIMWMMQSKIVFLPAPTPLPTAHNSRCLSRDASICLCR